MKEGGTFSANVYNYNFGVPGGIVEKKPIQKTYSKYIVDFVESGY